MLTHTVDCYMTRIPHYRGLLIIWKPAQKALLTLRLHKVSPHHNGIKPVPSCETSSVPFSMLFMPFEGNVPISRQNLEKSIILNYSSLKPPGGHADGESSSIKENPTQLYFFHQTMLHGNDMMYESRKNPTSHLCWHKCSGENPSNKLLLVNESPIIFLTTCQVMRLVHMVQLFTNYCQFDNVVYAIELIPV